MKFTHYDLGHLTKGQKVEITLVGNAANVHLMTQKEFEEFTKNSVHKGMGGLTLQSPVYFTVPHDCHWFVTIDFGGYIGKVNTKVVTYPLPTDSEIPST